MLVCKQLRLKHTLRCTGRCIWPDVIAGYSKWFTVNTSGIILLLIKCLYKHVFLWFMFGIFVYQCELLSVLWFRVDCFQLQLHDCLHLNLCHAAQYVFSISLPEITYSYPWNKFRIKLMWRRKGMLWFVQRFKIKKHLCKFLLRLTTQPLSCTHFAE